MPGFIQTVFLGHDLALFLPDPNWSTKLEIGHRLTVDVDAGQTGREDRKPRHLVLRHELTAQWNTSPAETLALETILANLGSSYIGVPIFYDQLTPDRWADRIYDAAWVLNYDETGYSLHASDLLPETPVRRWFAPLLVGRRDALPKLQATDDRRAQFKFKLIERSPWDFRIAPAPEGEVSANWPASLQANWKQLPESSTEDIVVYNDVGDGRVQGVDGLEGVTHRTQSMLVTCQTRAQIRTLLNFFVARRGRTGAFDAPWCLRPGPDTETTPHTTKARFADELLTLTFGATAADAKIGFVQLPWEIAGVAGETPEQASDAYLYKFTMRVPGGPLLWRFTSWEHDLVRNEDGVAVSYLGDTSGLWEHDQIAHAIDLSDEPTTIGSWIFATNPLVRVMQRSLDVPLEVEIYRCDPAAPQGAELVYAGEVADVANTGRKLSATTTVLGGRLDIKVPNFFFGPVCNYEFCGAGCNDHGSMDPTDWTFAGTVISQIGNDLTLAVTANPPAAALINDYFAKAWVKKGAGETYELRHVTRSVDLGGGHQKFTLKKPLRAVVAGEALSFRVYCAGTRGECEDKFDNYPHMGAHPHIGDQNLSIPQREPDSKGAGK